MSRWRRSVELTRSPVLPKSASATLRATSDSTSSLGAWLVMNARTTCSCGPTGSVKHTAGRTFVLERSSNGKLTRTTLPLTGQRLPVRKRVDVLGGVVEKRERRTCGCGRLPVHFRQIVFRHQHQHADASRTREIERLVKVQRTGFVNVPGDFDGLHAARLRHRAQACKPPVPRRPADRVSRRVYSDRPEQRPLSARIEGQGRHACTPLDTPVPSSVEGPAQGQGRHSGRADFGLASGLQVAARAGGQSR